MEQFYGTILWRPFYGACVLGFRKLACWTIRILVCPHLATLHCDHAGSLLCKFVRDAEALYSKQILVYNVHNLLHLADDAKQLGCLDDFSAFPFENKLGHLKKLVKKPQIPLQQVVRWINEMQQQQWTSCDKSDKPAVSSEHIEGPLIASLHNATQYWKLKTTKWMLTAGENNNCIIIIIIIIIIIVYYTKKVA